MTKACFKNGSCVTVAIRECKPAPQDGYTGLDALTQLIEPYVSSRANPLVDSICVEGIRLAAGALRRAFYDGSDKDARRDMALASLFGGLGLANAGLGVVHGFASPLGGQLKAPHGALCAAVLPHGMAGNLTALRARAPQHPALERYDTIARLITGKVERARRTELIGYVSSALISTFLRFVHGALTTLIYRV